MAEVIDKKDEGKAPMSLLSTFWDALGEVAKVLEFGNQKYQSIENFKGIPKGRRRMIDAALRHIYASAAGEEKDPESKLAHLAHGACCTLMALWFELHQKDSATLANGVWREPDEQDERLFEVWVKPNQVFPAARSEWFPGIYTIAEIRSKLAKEYEIRPHLQDDRVL